MDYYYYLIHLLLFSLLASLHLNNNISVVADNDDVDFYQNYYVPDQPWAKDHIQILDQHRLVNLTLDQQTGSAGFNSKNKYGSGWFNMKIKMPKKDSTAIITSFYLVSEGYGRDEVDFELLGGTGDSKRPYVLQTNVFVDGEGGREQRMHFWFDPTQDFHNYTFFWNSHQLVFYVDSIPVRVMKNTTNEGGKFPTKAMAGIARLWNGTWASGGVEVNWNEGPFEADYRGFGINGCQTNTNNDPQCNDASKYWWNAEKYWSLDAAQMQAYRDVRTKYLVYDYCSQSIARYPECQHEYN